MDKEKKQSYLLQETWKTFSKMLCVRKKLKSVFSSRHPVERWEMAFKTSCIHAICELSSNLFESQGNSSNGHTKDFVWIKWSLDNHLNDRDHLIQRLSDMAQLTSIELNCFMLNSWFFVLTWSFCLGVFFRMPISRSEKYNRNYAKIKWWGWWKDGGCRFALTQFSLLKSTKAMKRNQKPQLNTTPQASLFSCCCSNLIHDIWQNSR